MGMESACRIKSSLLALVLLIVQSSALVMDLNASGRVAFDQRSLLPDDGVVSDYGGAHQDVASSSASKAAVKDDSVAFGDYTFTLIYCGLVGATILLVCGIVSAMASGVGNADGANSGIDLLDRNIWSLNLVAAVGQARFANGKRVPPAIVMLITASMCLLQMLAILLMVTSMDPRSAPVTRFPSSPWLQQASGTPVNCMKWIMTAFLTVGQVAEVAQSLRIICCCWKLDKSKLLVPIIFPVLAAAAQYVVSMAVVWSGVNIILTFHSCADIVYSSMSVFFITSFDEMVFECLQFLCEISGEFDINHTGTIPENPNKLAFNEASWSKGAGAQGPLNKFLPQHRKERHSFSGELSLSHHGTEEKPSMPCGKIDENSDTDASTHRSVKGAGTSDAFPFWLWAVLKLLGALPIIFGFYTLGQAFYTDVMPLRRLRHIIDMY